MPILGIFLRYRKAQDECHPTSPSPTPRNSHGIGHALHRSPAAGFRDGAVKPARRKVAGALALGAIGSTAVAAKTPEATRRRYAALGAPAGPYAHGVRHGDLLFLSGLTAYGTPAQKGDIAAQADAILARIAAVAAEEGRDLGSLVKVTIFVTDLTHIDALRERLQAHYGNALPASSLIRVAGLFHPDLAIEIEAILALA